MLVWSGRVDPRSTKKMIVLGGEQPGKGLELALCRITRTPLHLANQVGFLNYSDNL
mgnify:FL=1|jgi:hypothetical protein